MWHTVVTFRELYVEYTMHQEEMRMDYHVCQTCTYCRDELNSLRERATRLEKPLLTVSQQEETVCSKTPYPCNGWVIRDKILHSCIIGENHKRECACRCGLRWGE